MFDEQPDGDPHGECAAEIYSLQTQVESYRNGNTELLEALMDMVGQFFIGNDMDGPLRHSFMSAEEIAMAVLIAAGMAEEIGPNCCRLLWDKLEARKPKQQTWAEAVRECIADPAEVERLLGLSNDASTDEVHQAARGIK